MAFPTPSQSALVNFDDPVIQALTHGSRWILGSTRQLTWATANNVSYQFPDPVFAAVVLSNVLSPIEDVIDVDFVYAGHYGNVTDSTANITYTFSDGLLSSLMFPPGALAQAVFPFAPHGDDFSILMTGSTTGYAYAEGDVWLNRPAMVTSGYMNFWDGAAGKFVLLHETGHALGLKHPHDGGGSNRPTFTDIGLSLTRQIEFNQGDLFDVDAFTMMSYNDDVSWNTWEGDPATLMPLDVLALQALYGPNPRTNAGDSTHLILHDGVYATTWDAGGNDVIDGSLSDAGWLMFLETPIDDPLLSPHMQRVALAVPLIGGGLDETTLKWVFDAENAYGSQFDDVLVGSRLSNFLSGNAGHDIVVGLGGDDTLFGFGGLDTLSGDDGNDWISGGDGDDDLTGGEGNDVFDYHSAHRGGNDTMRGGAGDDVYYLYGNDLVDEKPGEGVDTVFVQISGSLESLPNVENAVAITGTGGVWLTGSALHNWLQGNEAANVLRGLGGNDVLVGGGGNDTIDGGSGVDFAHYAGPRAQATIELNSTTSPYTATVTAPGLGTDSLTNVERLVFSDLSVAFDVTPTGNVLDPVTKGEGGNGGKAYRLYQAAFDRTPDLPGLGYWIAQVDAGAKLSDIATGFVGSDEFKTLYGANPTNQEYTRALYLNVLDREPDAAGYAYWNALLNNEPWNGVHYGSTTRQQMLVDFSESAENKLNVLSVIGNGFDYLPWG